MINPISLEIIRLTFSYSSFQKTSMLLSDLSCFSLLHLGAHSTLYELSGWCRVNRKILLELDRHNLYGNGWKELDEGYCVKRDVFGL